MKSKKALMFVLRLLFGVGLVLAIWYIWANLTFWFTMGQGPLADLGDNYIMKHRYVYYSPSKQKEEFYLHAERIFREEVCKFAFSGPWLIGSTEKGWFAIQKKKRDVHYPISKEQLADITSLDIASVRMETEVWPYVIVRPEAVAAKNKVNRICWVLVFVVPITFGLAPYAWSALAGKQLKEQVASK